MLLRLDWQKFQGTNKATWACYGEVGGVPTPRQPITSNWILPQLVANSSGNPSNGYSVKLYNGDPASGGTLVGTVMDRLVVGREVCSMGF